MGLKQQQMGEGFRSSNTRRVLDCAARRSPGWWRVQAAFHICCLHMGNLTLPLSRRPPKNPIKSSASAQDDCLRLLQHFWASLLHAALFPVISSLLSCLPSASSRLTTFPPFLALSPFPTLLASLASYATPSWLQASNSNFIIYSRTSGLLTFSTSSCFLPPLASTPLILSLLHFFCPSPSRKWGQRVSLHCTTCVCVCVCVCGCVCEKKKKKGAWAIELEGQARENK